MKRREAAREIVLIVIGVTIALAGGAWYESRTERQDERLILSQLADALRVDHERLTRTRSIRAGQLDDVRALATAYQSGTGAIEHLNHGALTQFRHGGDELRTLRGVEESRL